MFAHRRYLWLTWWKTWSSSTRTSGRRRWVCSRPLQTVLTACNHRTQKPMSSDPHEDSPAQRRIRMEPKKKRSGRTKTEFCKRTVLGSRAAKRGGFKRGGFPIWTCPSFFCPFWNFPDFSGIFPICSGMVRGFSRFVPFLFRGLLRAPTRNSPERVRDTIWTFPEKSGKHPGLETPRFSFSR